MRATQTLYLDGKSLTINDVYYASVNQDRVELTSEARFRIKDCRNRLLEQIRKNPDQKIYGVNVGVGNLKDTFIDPSEAASFQEKYIKSHNCGTGGWLPVEIVRAMMIIRLNSFAHGVSAISLETVEMLENMLNSGVIPLVLDEGSVGASGDLVPLAMIAGVMIGLPESQAWYEGELMSAQEALEKAGLNPVKLGFKEAMALTNGTNFMSAGAVFACKETEHLLLAANYAAALSLEAIRGEKDAFSRFLADKRPHRGILEVSDLMRALLKGSMRATEEAQKVVFRGQDPSTATERVQDRYCFRAVPPVHGAALEAWHKFREVVEIEINSVTDNPLFEDTGEELKFHSGSNFHGQPLANVIDYLKLSLTSLSLISDKRSFSLLNKHLSFGLPSNLAIAPEKGDSGLMLAQYAGASRAGENRVLSNPASVMSISTSAGQEDFVSMGSVGVMHLLTVTDNVKTVLAIELLCALRALQMTNGKPGYLEGPLTQLGEGTINIFNSLNGLLPLPEGDTYLADEIETVKEWIDWDGLQGQDQA